jgi:pimeloyl-ACP methyl ester carboxylesterase
MFVDLPMHGASRDAQPTTVEGYADWVENVITQSGLEDFVLSGHSMGSLIALEVASRGNVALAHLVLLSVGAPMSVTEALLKDAVHDIESACDFMSTWSSSRGAKTQVAEAIAAHDAVRLSLEPGVLATDLHACNSYGGAVAAARAVSVPTTVVVAARDKMVPPHTADPVVEALATVELIEISDSGHTLQHEAPERVAATLEFAARSG